jgi:LDH2 family malate/lactate/ureidoglycolate dehydrogenase
MNRPPEEFVRVQEDRLLAFATTCLEKAGLETEHAALVGRLLVNSDLRGVRSHGTQAVFRYCMEHERGDLNPRPRIEVVHQTPTTVVLDGDGGLGYLPTMRATELAIARAKEVGIGMGLVRAIGHYGSAGHYTRVCMEAGCIGFSVQGPEGYGDYIGSPRRWDHTPSLGRFGCPPMSWAMPGGSEPAVVLDGGTPTMMGLRDRDAFEDVMSKIPSGVFKGVGFTAVSNLLSAGLTGLALPQARRLRERYAEAMTGSMVLAIHVGAVVPEELFRAESDQMVSDVRELFAPLPGYDRTLMPGAIEEEIAREHRARGIRYGGREQEEARKAAGRYGVPLPWG